MEGRVSEKREFKCSPHGNTRKNDDAYIRSTKKLIAKLKSRKEKHSAAQSIVSEIYNDEGGSSNVESFSTVPRNKAQVYRHAQQKKHISDFGEIMKMSMEGSFVNSFELNRSEQAKDTRPRACLCDERTLRDIQQFCCNEKFKTVLNIDPTYELGTRGSLLITASAYRHPMFINVDNDKNVLMPGPMMLHSERDTETYAYFGHNLSKQLKKKENMYFWDRL